MSIEVQQGAACLTVTEFCSTHRISRASLYNMWKRGIGPRVIRVGVKRLIPIEAAAAWRAERAS
jgi:predicted DNA-binding transcriptional regulator AlpA